MRRLGDFFVFACITFTIVMFIVWLYSIRVGAIG